MLTITRKLEFDAGHRIPNHESKCRNVHGHRYVLECTVTGELVTQPGHSSEGMIVDFGALKEIMNQFVVSDWDHAMLVWQNDTPLIAALYALETDSSHTLAKDEKGWGKHKTVVLPCIPTVEGLAEYAFGLLSAPLLSNGLKLTHLRLYETPNCWADCYAS